MAPSPAVATPTLATYPAYKTLRSRRNPLLISLAPLATQTAEPSVTVSPTHTVAGEEVVSSEPCRLLRVLRSLQNSLVSLVPHFEQFGGRAGQAKDPTIIVLTAVRPR